MSEPVERRAGEAGDHSRIAALSLRYGQAVRRFFSRRLRDGADVEDLTQEVFARLLKRAEIGDIANIEGYLFHTAANLLRERARKQARRPGDASADFDPDLVQSDEDFSPERILLGREAYARMVEALQELPERARTVFVLNRFEELSASEIARRLGVSVSTVEKDMMRAIAHLKARLA
ncbi:MAG TPA: sigma-70 family RNA polymerase sigma factor [Caulobacteraceae bacterium]